MPLTIGEKDQLARTANECARLAAQNRRLMDDIARITMATPPSSILMPMDVDAAVLYMNEKARADKLKTALEFYADKHTWEPMRNGEEESIWNDYGDTACLALGVPCLERPIPGGGGETLAERIDKLEQIIADPAKHKAYMQGVKVVQREDTNEPLNIFGG